MCSRRPLAADGISVSVSLFSRPDSDQASCLLNVFAVLIISHCVSVHRSVCLVVKTSKQALHFWLLSIRRSLNLVPHPTATFAQHTPDDFTLHNALEDGQPFNPKQPPRLGPRSRQYHHNYMYTYHKPAVTSRQLSPAQNRPSRKHSHRARMRH
jgi:hypothetical protein